MIEWLGWLAVRILNPHECEHQWYVKDRPHFCGLCSIGRYRP